MATTVTLEGLTKTYPDQAASAVHALSLTVTAGELITLLGPSGSGKSTVLKLIAGLEYPDSGDVILDGVSVLSVSAHRRGTVMVFQKPYLYPFMTVFDNVAFGLRVAGAHKDEIRSEVARVLELVELSGVESRRPNRLSGGEQQRVALARALVTRPRLLMLDEPLSSLDPAVRHTLQGAIRRLQRDLRLTTILVTHDLSEAMAMADRVALLEQGELIQVDEPRRLFERPATKAAARFVEVTTFVEGRLEGEWLHTELGALKVPPEPGPPRRAVFAIRPEHTTLVGSRGVNTVAGRVVGLEFRGEHTEVEVAFGGGFEAADQRVRARWSASCRPVIGESTLVSFPTEHLFALREDPIG